MGADPFFEQLNKVDEYRRQQQGEPEERLRRHGRFFYLALAVVLIIVLVAGYALLVSVHWFH
jgi:hypothetical protein